MENLAVVTGLENVSFHTNPKERKCQRMFKYHTIGLISHASKVMLKILQARLQQYMNHELPDIQAGFRKGRGEKERYTHLNAEFKRVTRRDKKAFLSDQCKEIEENNKMRRSEMSSRKLETLREHFMQRWTQ